MKRAGHLLERVAEPDNLRDAYLRAARGKRDRRDVIEFGRGLDERLREMRGQLLDGNVPLGGYRQFTVHDPKERVITVAPFAQRVLHHAVMNICEPHFERRLIDHCYACRKGKGRIAALETARRYCRKFPYFLKLDIRKYFDSVSHEHLLGHLHRVFKDAALLRLLEGIVRSFETSPGRGLPIGNLTSQHFANLYLGPLDRHVLARSGPGAGGYVRYMDDMLVWSRCRTHLRDLRESIRGFLAGRLGLALKHERIGTVAQGAPFLGCVLLPRHRLLNWRSRLRLRRRLGLLDRLLAEGRIDENEAQQRATAMCAYARTAASWHCRQDILTGHFRAAALGQTAPTGAFAAAVGTTTRTTAPSRTATTTSRTTGTTTTDSVSPAAPEPPRRMRGFPEPAAVPFPPPPEARDKTTNPTPPGAGSPVDAGSNAPGGPLDTGRPAAES